MGVASTAEPRAEVALLDQSWFTFLELFKFILHLLVGFLHRCCLVGNSFQHLALLSFQPLDFSLGCFLALHRCRCHLSVFNEEVD